MVRRHAADWMPPTPSQKNLMISDAGCGTGFNLIHSEAAGMLRSV